MTMAWRMARGMRDVALVVSLLAAWPVISVAQAQVQVDHLQGELRGGEWLEPGERRHNPRGYKRRYGPEYDGRCHGPFRYRYLNPRINARPSIDVHVEGLGLDGRDSSRNERKETGPSICRQASGTTWSTQAQTCSDEAPAQRANTWSTLPAQ